MNALVYDSDEEEKPQEVAPKSRVVVKKRVILSDSEDDEPAPKTKTKKAKGKERLKGVDSDTERSLKAMMDVDDGK